MTNKEFTKLRKSSSSNTHNISVPAVMVLDSTFPFKTDDEIVIEIDDNNARLIIRKKRADEST